MGTPPVKIIEKEKFNSNKITEESRISVNSQILQSGKMELHPVILGKKILSPIFPQNYGRNGQIGAAFQRGNLTKTRANLAVPSVILRKIGDKIFVLKLRDEAPFSRFGEFGNLRKFDFIP